MTEEPVRVTQWLMSLPQDAVLETGIACREGRWRVFLKADSDRILSKQEFSSRKEALDHMMEVMAIVKSELKGDRAWLSPPPLQ